MSQAIYYPWIDIKDEHWLKNAVLYWDSLRTIVPARLHDPYTTRTGRALADLGFLNPIEIDPSTPEVEELGQHILRVAESGGLHRLWSSAPDVLERGDALQTVNYFHIDKMKVSGLIRRHLGRPTGDGHLEVEAKLGHAYMTALATRLSEKLGISLVTPLPVADRLAMAMRATATIGDPLRGREWRRRERLPGAVAQGLLIDVAISSIGVSPDASLESLIAFRSRHEDELRRFRNAINALTAPINEDIPADALRQRVVDLYRDEVGPSVAGLRAALKGSGLKSFVNTALKMSSISVGATTVLGMSGLPLPVAIAAGAGISVTGSLVNTFLERKQKLLEAPYAYLLSMGAELPREQ